MSKRDNKRSAGGQWENDESAALTPEEAAVAGYQLPVDLLNNIKTSKGQSLNTQNAIVQQSDGTMSYRGFTLTARGISAVEGTPTEADWQAVGKTLTKISSGIQWMIGDWINFGEREYSKTYEAIAEQTGYKKETLHQWRYVCGSIEFSIRIENLTFAHHQLVAAFDAAAQREWLEYAAAHRLSVAAMRREMQKAAESTSPTEVTLTPRLQKVVKSELKTQERLIRAKRNAKGGERLALATWAQERVEWWTNFANSFKVE